MKTVFYYGVMDSGKSALLLMAYYRYINKGMTPLLIKPEIDTRNGVDMVSSRIGLKQKVDLSLSDESNIFSLLDNFFKKTNPEKCIIMIDEAQFLSTKSICGIIEYAFNKNIDVVAYGLLKDFQNNLFEGSQAWLETSDNIVEVKTTCSKCTRKATCNLRLNDGKPVYDGDVVQIGGNESYVSVCREHYYNYN